ncbi:hypothetical protein [Bifidobacterium tsurumiense]|uniref:hypothetical protein n=1 Tax=Bifidobacterium tsurumiense TaxID=356829 RepID=UPI000B169EA6|nr:hypothetical protein [Bifidobacterium tsurumiense]
MAGDAVVLVALLMTCAVIGVLWPLVCVALRLLVVLAGLVARLVGFLFRMVRGGAS